MTKKIRIIEGDDTLTALLDFPDHFVNRAVAEPQAVHHVFRAEGAGMMAASGGLDEGLVHVSEISKEKIKTPIGKYNIGDVITARVMNINSEERRIGLSIKRMEIENEQNLLSEYVNNIGPATSSFGEILRENLQEKLNED